jgi:hypothetical protein
LSLPWLKIQPFINGKLGGWVAENYLGFSRIMSWYFEYARYLAEPEPYADPSTEPKHWLKSQTIAWLQARGLASIGSAIELKATVIAYYDTGLVSSILPVRGCDVNVVMDVVHSLQDLISNCMKLDGQPYEKYLVESSVGVFLSAYALLEESLYDSPLPKYLSSYNFMSLLNLSRQVENYSSLHFLWEGKVQGEGYLRSVKRELTIGLNKNWKKWLLDNLHLDKSFNNIAKAFHEVDPNKPMKSITSVKLSFIKTKMKL